MRRFRFPIIALLSATLLGLEFVWTRIFSAEFFYSFAFLVLSLAILGLGLGALALRLLPALGRPRRLATFLALTGVCTLAGPPLVFCLGLDFAELLNRWSMVGRLLLTILLLGAAYFFGGMALALLLRRNHRDMPRLYMADLAGAAAGVLLATLLMNMCGTPAATFLVAVPVLLAALLAARGFVRVVPVVLLIAPFVLTRYADRLLEAPREERAPVVYKHWDATAKIKVYAYAEQVRGLNIDNAANSPVFGFDGNWNRSAEDRFEFGIDVSRLIQRFKSCTFLSLGAGGGGDVLQALQAGATEIHAVEVIPHVNDLMLTGELAGFTGRIYRDPRVHVVTEDARAYVRQHKRKFDVIYSLSSNTFAALASGSFALAENYLFTTEAFRDYWESLTDDGFMMMEHQFYMPRLVPALLDAFQLLGVREPQTHFAVYDLPHMRRQMVLISKRPLTDEIRNTAFGDLTPENFDDIHLLVPASEAEKERLVNRVVQQGWRQAALSSPINVAPCTDDRPFVGQMGCWKNVRWERPAKLAGYDVAGYPLSQLVLLVILLVTIVLVLPLNLLPYLSRRPRLHATPWLFFFAIGVAFMSVEVVLIQKYTLFVGPSVYSVATILLALLLGSALGSRSAARLSTTLAFGGLLVWLLLEAFALRQVTTALVGLPLWARMATTAALVAPLGFFMGMPFPKGALRIGTLVDWAFAVNGAASVVGATAILLFAMRFGFRAALLAAAGCYGVAWLLMARTRGWTPVHPAWLAPPVSDSAGLATPCRPAPAESLTGVEL